MLKLCRAMSAAVSTEHIKFNDIVSKKFTHSKL